MIPIILIRKNKAVKRRAGCFQKKANAAKGIGEMHEYFDSLTAGTRSGDLISAVLAAEENETY